MIRTMPPLPEPKTRARVSVRAKTVFLGLNALLGMGLIEATARFLVPPPLEWREHPTRILRYDPERAWALRPNTEDFTVDKPTRINSDGFRDREYPIAKPEGTTRVVCVGDSYTYGWGVDVSDSYPKQLERALSRRRPTECLNLGVFGYNADQARLALERQGLKYTPDLVIYSFYWDDLLPVRADLMKPDSFATHADEGSGLTFWARHTLRRSRAVFLTVQRLRALKAALTPSKSRFMRCYSALLAGDHASIRDLWDDEANEICRMRDDAARVGARLAVIVWPLEAQVLSDVPACRFEKEAQQICEEAGVVCIPLLEPLRQLAREGQSPYLPYEQHPTPEGYRRAVATIERALVEQGLVK